MLYRLFKKIAFSFDPEFAHHQTIFMMKMLGRFFPKSISDKRLNFSRNNLFFSSPFGLAAGLDKNGECIDFLSKLKFGFIEIGTVTPIAQSGNEKPRLFRYPKIFSLRNRMGFNNDGMDKVLSNIRECQKHHKLLGVNIGKNKNTSNDLAYKDYEILLKTFDQEKSVDYLVINISSPNTPGLRDLLQDEGLKSIFDVLKSNQFKKPIYLKISPDMNFDQVKNLLMLASNSKLSGIVATNTTIMSEYGEGGMSGRILYEKANAMREFLLKELTQFPHLHLIGVGGFENFEQIKDYWKMGGDAIQLYSSFIYQGPKLLNELEKKLIHEMNQFSVSSFDEYLKKLR